MEQALARVQEKMRELIKKYQHTSKERDRLQEENKHLRTLLKEREMLLEELQLTKDATLVSHSITDEKARKELGKKVNQYIREIDRCITILAE